ncbi:Growth-regulated alpha protein [Oryzias melastigma]|uniref:Growth-regulated alpha protein n=1 Tax=Oryzias melastigma TaxID=30732 RepID=A0A834FBQ1_ORYME|nr:Growth-regulated alpha protein [Oryzias melastigma]
MNSAIQSIVMLVCVAVCTGATMKQCQCLNPARGVKPSLIAQVKILPPLPYCRKAQVIVTLKDDRRVCLDPAFEFTQAVLRVMKLQNERKSAANLRLSTTTAATASVKPTW